MGGCVCVFVLQRKPRWERRSGTSSVCETGSTRRGCGPTGQRKPATGKRLARTGTWPAAVGRHSWWVWRRRWCFTRDEHPRARKPTGSCMSIDWRGLLLLIPTPIISNLLLASSTTTRFVKPTNPTISSTSAPPAPSKFQHQISLVLFLGLLVGFFVGLLNPSFFLGYCWYTPLLPSSSFSSSSSFFFFFFSSPLILFFFSKKFTKFLQVNVPWYCVFGRLTFWQIQCRLL